MSEKITGLLRFALRSRVIVVASALTIGLAAVGAAVAGNGNGGGNGNDGGSSHANSASTTHGNAGGGGGSSFGKQTSLLGALNAAHASNQAFAHASANSRVGKIRAYYLANKDYAALKILANATDAVALKSVFDAFGSAVTTAYTNLLADPTNTIKQTAYADALAATATATTPALTDAQVTLAYNNWQAAVTADNAAATAYTTMTNDLALAANKTPVDAATKVALDNLLAGKTIY